MPSQSSIDVFDMGRTLLGNEPIFYLFGVAFRTAIVYPLSLFLLRLLGKRSLRELTPTDFLIVIALGSAIGDSMFDPEVPLTHVLLVAAIVALLQRTLSKAIEISPRAEYIIEGSATLVDEPKLAKAVWNGRKSELGNNAPNPQNLQNFLKSKIAWDKRYQGMNKVMLDFYRELIRLRRNIPALARLTKKKARGFCQWEYDYYEKTMGSKPSSNGYEF